MNNNEFDKLLKDKINSLDFKATEEGWRKLSQQLPKKKRKILPLYLNAAAGIAALCLISLFFYQNRQQSVNTSFVKTKNTKIAMPHQRSNTGTQHTVFSPINKIITINAKPAVREERDEKHGNLFMQNDKISTLEKQFPDTTTPTNEEKVITKNPEADKQHEPFVLFSTPQTSNKPKWQIYAGLGRNKIMPVQYNVALSTTMPLAKNFNLDLSFSLGTAEAVYDKGFAVNGMNVNAGTGAAGTNYVQTQKLIKANYRRQMYNVGLSPSVNCRISKKLSLNTGIYYQKYFSNELTLEKDNLESAIVQSGIISPSIQVALWDWGVKGGIDYALTNKMKLQISHLQGCHPYIRTGDQSIYLGNTQIGLKLQLNK